MDEKKLEKKMKAFANASRLKILRYLKKNKFASVTDIAEGVRCSYKATSKHLAILFQADVLDREQATYEMHYRLSGDMDPTTKSILKLI